MRASTERLITAVGVLAFFVPQFWLAYGQPAWGLDSPFPFTILRSLQMPILLGLSAAALAWASKSPSERMLLYSVVAASLAEIVTIEAMLWLHQPLLVPAVFMLNAFMAVQFLRFGVSSLSAKPHHAVRAKTHLEKKPATITGGIFRLGLVIVATTTVAYLLVPVL